MQLFYYQCNYFIRKSFGLYYYIEIYQFKKRGQTVPKFLSLHTTYFCFRHKSNSDLSIFYGHQVTYSRVCAQAGLGI